MDFHLFETRQRSNDRRRSTFDRARLLLTFRGLLVNEFCGISLSLSTVTANLLIVDDVITLWGHWVRVTKCGSWTKFPRESSWRLRPDRKAAKAKVILSPICGKRYGCKHVILETKSRSVIGSPRKLNYVVGG